MPPKAKFTRDEIVDAALDLIRTGGLSSLTARALGTRLGSSARPIFTVFETMDELQKAVMEAAQALYSEYIDSGLSEDKSFRGVGTKYILFAIKEPKLFQLLFMAEQECIPDLTSILPLIDSNYKKILLSIQSDYGLTGASAEKLYRHLWIYTHGIAALCATKMCVFTEKEIGKMITEVCVSLLGKIKEDKNHD